MPKLAAVLTLLGVCLMLACSTDDSGGCLENVLPAIVVEIRDSTTSAPLAAGAVALVVDGAFSDTLRLVTPQDSLFREGPDERAGTYDLTISHPGYATWTRSNIVVSRDACHVRTVQILAFLQQP